MDDQMTHERILIAIALVLCAVIIGYNAFFVPEVTSPTVIYVQSQVSNLQNEEYIPSAGLLNLNTATQQQLIDVLPEVGQATAKRIIQYREEHGGFHSIEELNEIEGIGEKTFEKLRPYVTVE